jgi:hypothetical protein
MRDPLAKIKRDLGRPKTTGRGTLICLRPHADILNPLNEWIERHPAPRPTQQEAVREGLRDWLTGMGMMPPPDKQRHRE